MNDSEAALMACLRLAKSEPWQATASSKQTIVKGTVGIYGDHEEWVTVARTLKQVVCTL